jgi:hypothetical protein
MKPQNQDGHAARGAPAPGVADICLANTMQTEDHFYESALREIVEKRVVQGTFARAYASSDGDANRTRALYIKMRVEQLALDAEAQRKAKDEFERLRFEAEQARRRREELEAKRRADEVARAREAEVRQKISYKQFISEQPNLASYSKKTRMALYENWVHRKFRDANIQAG